MAISAPKRDRLHELRVPVGILVILIESFLYLSFAAAAVYPLLLPLHWLLARRFGIVGRAFWALLGGWTSFVATWWYLVFATREHHPLVWPHLRWVIAFAIALAIFGLPRHGGAIKGVTST